MRRLRLCGRFWLVRQRLDLRLLDGLCLGHGRRLGHRLERLLRGLGDGGRRGLRLRRGGNRLGGRRRGNSLRLALGDLRRLWLRRRFQIGRRRLDLRLVSHRLGRFCRRLSAGAFRLCRRGWSRRIDGMIGALRCVGYGAGRRRIGWFCRRHFHCRRFRWLIPGLGRRGRRLGIDGDGVRVAAAGTRYRDEHGLQRGCAEQNAAGGKHEKGQFRSVFLGHGRRVGVARLPTEPVTPNPAYLSRGLPPMLDLYFGPGACACRRSRRLCSRCFARAQQPSVTVAESSPNPQQNVVH